MIPLYDSRLSLNCYKVRLLLALLGAPYTRHPVDIRKGESAQVILNQLYKQTQLQDTFGISMLAIVQKRPSDPTLVTPCA